LLRLTTELSRESRHQIIAVIDRACVFELIAKTASAVAINPGAIVGIRKLRVERNSSSIPTKHKFAMFKDVANRDIVFTRRLLAAALDANLAVVNPQGY
jgi:hypothetical protein